MSDDCKKQMRDTLERIAADLENSTVAWVDDDGSELHDAVQGEDYWGDAHVVTYGIVLRDGTNWGASYIPANDDGDIGYRGEVYHADDWVETYNGDLILGGVRHDDAREMTGYDYLTDCLDIEYRTGSDRQYRSASILVGFGGPNIWIDTKREMVCGAWWGDYAEVPYTDGIGLDDACQELWKMGA